MAISFNNPKKLFLLDQDGTLYKGSVLFPGTPSFLAKIKAIGARYVFLTNNSSKGIHEYIAKMKGFGIETTASDFYTSANATIDYLLAFHPGDNVYVVGTKALLRQFSEAGIKLTNSEDASVAVLAYDTELTYEKITKLVNLLRNEKVTYLATNPDMLCPTEDGYLPDCGSFAEMIERATGRKPKFLGKPSPLYISSVLKAFGVKKEEAIIIGDRLYTDLEAGVNSGVDSLIVYSGEATKEDVLKYHVQPTYTALNISEIL